MTVNWQNITYSGITPLMLAVASQSSEYGGGIESVQSLLSQPDIGKKDILHLFYSILTKTYIIDIYHENALEQTAHFYVVDSISSSTDVLDLLVEAGADLTKKDIWGFNILHWAAYYCKEEMAKHLIDELGMDKEVKLSQDFSHTALDIAKTMGCKEQVDNWKAFKKVLG